MKIDFSPPHIEEWEIREVEKVLRSGWITTGPRTKEFEERLKEYTGAEGCACLASATAAMELTLRILGIGPGDQVITTAYTYTATAAVIDHVGAEIVMVDTVKDGFHIDPSKIAEAITSKTKAILPVDIGGRLCDYKGIFQAIEDKKNLFTPSNDIQEKLGRIAVIADSAHGLGASDNGKMSGTVADFTTFSFHAVKNLTTAEGGAAVWRVGCGLDKDEIYRLYMLYSLHGQSKDALSKTKAGSWEYDIVFPGYKCNMTDIQAAMGILQLDRYEDILNRRRDIVNIYDDRLINGKVSSLEHFEGNIQSSCHLYLLRIEGIDEVKRNRIIEMMGERGIATNVHYKPLPMLTAYKNKGFSMGDYPNAFATYEKEISLPLHTRITDEEIDYICSTFHDVLEDVGV